MISELGYKAPAFNLGPPPETSPDGRNTYWAARKSVKIPIKKYFEWLNVNVWTCTATLTHSYTRYSGTETGSVNSTSKAFEVNVRRENKYPQFTSSGSFVNPPLIDGTVSQTTSSEFDELIPANYRMKQRLNVIESTNKETAYFNCQGSLTSNSQTSPYYFGWQIGIEFFLAAFENLTENSSYYDPETKYIWPEIGFRSEGTTGPTGNYLVNWAGIYGDDFFAHNSVSLTVDGINIPAQGYVNGTENEGIYGAPGSTTSIFISIAWTKGATRDL
jgi:hypothetical protein